MRLSSETEHLSKKMGNLSQQNKTNRRKYFCSFVDHPFGLKDRYILTSILLVQSHIFGVYGCLMVVAGQYPFMLFPLCKIKTEQERFLKS
jgi:hypothetical protein